jgi:hypothetical protein
MKVDARRMNPAVSGNQPPEESSDRSAALAVWLLAPYLTPRVDLYPVELRALIIAVITKRTYHQTRFIQQGSFGNGLAMRAAIVGLTACPSGNMHSHERRGHGAARF